MVKNKSLYHFGFVVEQVLGHITHGQNLQAYVSENPEIQAYWSLPIWNASGLVGKIPNWTLKVGMQVRHDLAKIQQEKKLDALFFHTQVTAVLAQKWLMRVPSVVSIDATPLQYDSLGKFYNHDSGPNWMEKLKYKLDYQCFKSAQHLVTWSEWAKHSLVNDYNIPEDKIAVIPPGVNVIEWHRPQPRSRRADTSVKILFVGANLERKGGHLLLEAFRTLKATLSSSRPMLVVELHLVTKDQLTEEPDIFVYNDMKPNSKLLKQLYHDCDIFCLPTLGDCLPMVLSEAAAAGLPTISTNVAAIPEITLDGKTGFIIPPGDVSSLTEALKKLVVDTNLRYQQGLQAVELASHKFDALTNAVRLLDLLKEVANSRT